MNPDLSVIIFAFNEEENVAPVLTELIAWLREHEPSSEIIFVDDGSKDETLARARQALRPWPHTALGHPSNRGIGAALKTGVQAAHGRWVTFMPADGQIEPDAIRTLRTAAADQRSDVIFSIYDQRNDGVHRKLLSGGVRGLIRLVHGVRMQSDGPYLFRRRLFLPEQLPSDTFFLNFEFPIGVMQAGLPYRITTIRCRPRRSGFSKSAALKKINAVSKDLFALRIRRLRTLLARL